MKHARRIALVAFLLALVAIIAIGFYRAATHQESRPDGTGVPTGSSSAAR
jgi:hypothetical protein